MATLADLRSRIIRETNREELTEAPGDPLAANSETLDQCIKRAIEFYANERFYFNEAILTATTTAGSDTIDYPPSLRFIDRLSIDVGGSRYGLISREYTTIDQWLGYGSSQGQPTDYSVSNAGIRLYPIPNTAYTLTFLGVCDIQMDYDDPDNTTAWTNQAQDLIAARTRFLLMRDYFRDNEGAAVAQLAEQQALNDLRGKTTRQIGTGRVRGAW